MDDKKKPENGTYTQVPNVFFDTCDLPESAQILYLRLYRHIAYKDERKFTGSIRKLSALVRLSKSTVERMIKVLEESRLVNISYEPSQEQDRKIMTITINPQELWLLNKQHYEDNDVPNWDKVMPPIKVLSQIGTLCPDMGHNDVNLGQDAINLGQSVPDTSSKSEQERISTDNTSNTIERKNGASLQNATVSTQDEDHSFVHSSLSLSLSSSQETKQTKSAIVLTEKEQRIIKFGKKDIFKAADPIIDEKLKEECAKLAELIETQEQFDSLVAVVRKRFPKGAIHLKNLTKPNVLNEWSQAQEQCTPDTQVPSAPDNDFVVTDNELAEDIKKTVRFYDADDRFEECLESIIDFKRKAGLSNYKVCDMIANASIGVQRDQGIDAFLEKLQYSLYW